MAFLMGGEVGGSGLGRGVDSVMPAKAKPFPGQVNADCASYRAGKGPR